MTTSKSVYFMNIDQIVTDEFFFKKLSVVVSSWQG